MFGDAAKKKRSFWQVWGCERTAVCQQPSSLSHFWRDSSLQIEIESCYYSFHCQTGLWWHFTIQITTRESHRGKFHRGRGLKCKTLQKEKQNVSPCCSCSVVWVSRIQSTPGSLGRAPTVAISPWTVFLWILWGHSDEQRGHVVRFICRCCFLFCLVLQALSHSRPPSAGIVSRHESQDCVRLCALHAMYSRKCLKHQCQLQLFSLTCQQWHSAPVFSSNLEHVSKDAVCVWAQPRVGNCMHFQWYYEIFFTWRGGKPFCFPGLFDCSIIDTKTPRIIKGPKQAQFGYTVQQHVGVGGEKW